MTLTYQTKGSTETKEVRVEFDPPLLGYEEVKPRLMNMKGEAEEALGMVRPPLSFPDFAQRLTHISSRPARRAAARTYAHRSSPRR